MALPGSTEDMTSEWAATSIAVLASGARATR